ncbi:MAG: aminoacyl-tRNA hydrolase [bacterium]|nr:aminoacyl-tRNA hydrolase [bacterium]
MITKLIVGLGNPGKQYEHTRHNAGFWALEYLIGNWKPARPAGGLEIGNFQNNFNSKIWETRVNGQKVILVEPQGFMNNSGQAVQSLIALYKLNPETDLLVVHDDTDLLLGKWKSAFDSSSAGHKGVQDIIDKLGTQKFHRLRLGVESRDSRDDLATETFVLQNFTPEQKKTFYSETMPATIVEIEEFIKK